MPGPIAVQWSTDGRVSNTMPKLAWAALWSVAWLLVSSALVVVRAPLDWRRLLLILLQGTLVADYITTVENNIGANSWRQAEPLELVPAGALALVAAGAVWLIERALDR